MKFQTVLVILALTLAFAQDRNGPGSQPSSPRTQPRRIVNYQVTGNGITFQMVANPADDSTNSKISFSMKGTQNGFFADFKYESSQTNPLMYSAIIYRILEFIPKVNPSFTPGVDTPVSYVIPNQYKSAVITVSTVGTATKYDFTLGTTDGLLTVVGHVVTDFTTNGTFLYTPNTVKLDYIISNWNYVANASKLALESRIQTGDDCKEDNGQVQINSNAVIKGSFAWSPTVDADSATVNVLSSSIDKSSDQNVTREGETQFRVFHTFDTTNRVKVFSWDPTIGVTSNSGIISLSIGLLFLVFAIIM